MCFARVCVLQVMEDGQISALISSPVSSTLEQEEQEEEEDGEMARLHVKHREHCPRLAFYIT